MKTKVKAWAIVADGELCGRVDLGGPSIYWTKAKATRGGILHERSFLKVVRVEITLTAKGQAKK